MGNMTTPITDSTFEKDALTSEVPVLVDFWAEWCGPCRAIAPKLEEIAQELNGKIKVVKCNVDENPETPSRYGIRGIPTLILFKKGKEVDQIVGNQSKESILSVIQKHLI